MPLRVVALWHSFTTRITQIQEEHGVPRTNIIKYRLRGGMPCSSNPLMNAVTSSSLVEGLTDKIAQTQEEHGVFRSKPNHCISLRRNMPCSSLYLVNTATGYIAEQVTT